MKLFSVVMPSFQTEPKVFVLVLRGAAHVGGGGSSYSGGRRAWYQNLIRTPAYKACTTTIGTVSLASKLNRGALEN